MSRSAEDRTAIYAAMLEVTREGMPAARHLRGDIYELRADGADESYRLLFAPEGRKGRILFALNAFSKRTQRTPSRMIELAERRLSDWRSGQRRIYHP